MHSEKSDARSEPLLATCVEQVRHATATLHKLILEEPFPDLDFTPESSEEIREVIDKVGVWGLKVYDAYGSPTSSSGVLAHFSDSFQRRSEDTLRRRPQLDSAADVLGPIPDQLHHSMATAADPVMQNETP